ncbi:hypothetical protein [Aurantiacibacter spongiae]|uniref:Uncharacterized protein n=1 Tax=Aurantiacibacter spongiae TaxID=2488860 RepID=A0A3N5DR07_9SPHN|nr:hypothetical protein [Aurantiacibacter spongiae]RPF71561.1 hypothetical protein EG799_07965 [Aurantiacibacter spongiae]
MTMDPARRRHFLVPGLVLFLAACSGDAADPPRAPTRGERAALADAADMLDTREPEAPGAPPARR